MINKLKDRSRVRITFPPEGERSAFKARVDLIGADGQATMVPGVSKVTIVLDPNDVIRATIECIELELPPEVYGEIGSEFKVFTHKTKKD